MMTKRMAIAALGAAATTLLMPSRRANAIFGAGIGNSVNDTMDRNGVARDRDGDGFNDRGLSEGSGGYADDANRGNERDFRGYRDRETPYAPKKPHLRDYEYPASGGGSGGQDGFGGNSQSNQAGGAGQNPSNY